jgi:hypothetical protein
MTLRIRKIEIWLQRESEKSREPAIDRCWDKLRLGSIPAASIKMSFLALQLEVWRCRLQDGLTCATCFLIFFSIDLNDSCHSSLNVSLR